MTGGAEYFRSILDSTADGILVVDVDGNVLSSNRRFAELWSIPPELLARGEDEAMLSYVLEQLADPEGFLRRVRELYASPEEDLDVILFEDGRVLERFSAPLLREGTVTGRVWSFRDVTEKLRAEEERRRLERQMLHAQKLESLGVLAGGIAHDFNNLLVSILGNADLALAEVPPSTTAHELLQEVVVAGRRAGELCNQLLAYSGSGRFSVELVDLAQVVRDMTDLLEVTLPKGVELVREFDPDLPPVEVDVNQMRQVVMNLITNAGEAVEGRERGSGAGRVGVSVRVLDCAPEELAGTMFGDEVEPGRYLCLEVTDDGVGMDEATRARIFDPFFSSKATGRGLGLAAIQGIVRGHAGTLSVESRPGEGARFRIYLPAQDGRAVSAPPRERAGEAATGDERILVVDDEEGVRTVARRMLESAGYRVTTAERGEEALGRLEAGGEEIAAVVLDVTMPGIGGEETLRELRRRRPDLCVLLSSGYAVEASDSRLAGGDRPDGFVQKPYLREELVSAVREALDRRR